MKLPHRILNSSGKTIQLVQKPLGVGGEGSVFEVIGAPDLVAKLYHQAISQNKLSKLEVMAKNCNNELLKISSWPKELLYGEKQGEVIGFLMPKINDYYEIHHLYSVGQRKKDFPDVDWGFLLNTAKNCAIAVETIHRNYHVIGDLNQKNLMVSKKGIVALVDCDSFQINSGNGIFRCEVGALEYTPPELHGLKLANIERTRNHDAFGLAVLIFHLLMMGRHPYSGVPKTNEDIPIESAIRNGYYAYSQSSTTKLKPPPKVPSLNFLDAEIIESFEKAFTFFPNKTPVRPSATDWKKLLESSLTKLKKCSNDSKHTFLSVAGSCPWCKLIATESIMFFIPSKSNNSLSFVLPNLDEYRRKISAYQDHFKNKVFNHIIEINGILASPVIIPKNIKKPTQKPNTYPYPPLPEMPPEPELPPSDPWIEMLSLIFFVCSLFYALIDTKIGIISAIVFGVIFTAMKNARQERENKMQEQLKLQHDLVIREIMDNHQKKCKEVDKRNSNMLSIWETDNKEWNDFVKIWKNNLAQSKAAIEIYKNQYSSLKSNTINTAKMIIDYSLGLISKIEIISEDYTLQKQRAIVNSKKLQLGTYLDSILIRDANLQSITNQRIIALQSFGIESAKDVKRLAYQKVPGIGKVLTERLFQWRADLSKKFIPVVGLPPTELARLNSKFAPALSPLKQEFENSIQKVSTINEEFFKQVADIESKLLQAKRAELTSEAYLTTLHNL